LHWWVQRRASPLVCAWRIGTFAHSNPYRICSL